ncbi:mitochondrial inner membrane protease subunit 1 [Tricharina praecox]|uniref:mitochondrial inner membrane protease subunit 1 n=1 Tax=Tricharina praecox TaxID=43433 RepID=UPI002220EFA9|nr:mitochondrial inner membrane protease subunit 1 [Tricharina praecox]KAI5854549.1 mitochondrial inner membrane protease subunit 1 [Tricharina praecox]
MTIPTNILLQRQLRLLRSSVLVVLWTHLVWSKCFSIGATIGPSMLPTINVSGDWVLISKFHTRGREVRVGDVVSFKHPHDGGDVRVVKRVIGLPGDFVVKDPSDGSGDMLQVPKGHMWVTGDNMPHSVDSRFYGPIPLAMVSGKIIARARHLWKWSWMRNPLDEEMMQVD